jgi:uncharacterized protein YkwD
VQIARDGRRIGPPADLVEATDMSSSTAVRRPLTRAPLTRLAAAVTTLALTGGAMIATGAAGSADAATTNRGPAPRLSAYDARLLHDINHARAVHGRRSLVATAGTTDVAHRWSCHMGKYSTLSHRTNLVTAISRSGSFGWHVMGENVGVSVGRDADVLFQAYMHSPKHRANILDRQYRFLGIHTELRHGERWNTLDFVDSYSGSYGATRATC